MVYRKERQFQLWLMEEEQEQEYLSLLFLERMVDIRGIWEFGLFSR